MEQGKGRKINKAALAAPLFIGPGNGEFDPTDFYFAGFFCPINSSPRFQKINKYVQKGGRLGAWVSFCFRGFLSGKL